MKFILEDRIKGYTYDQDKLIPPEETVQKFREKLAAIDLDILKQTRRIDNGRIGIPVFYSECGKDARDIIGFNKQMGKGATPAQAEASAIMELAERFSLFSFARESRNFFQAPFPMAGDNAMDFEQIIASVHDNEKDALRIKPVFDEISLQWTTGYNLTEETQTLIPFSWFYMINEFNAASAGNCREEAIDQGFCELVERHVCSLAAKRKLSAPGINLSSFTDPLVKDMLEKYQACNIQVYASDLSLGTGISTVGILAFDPSTFPHASEIIWTAGTSPDPQKAMSRALSETAQLAGDFNTHSCYEASGLPKFQRIEHANNLIHPQKMVNLEDLPNLSSHNIKTEVEQLISAIKTRLNAQVFTIDVTHPALGVPAFYTMIPGTHFRERLANASVGLFTARLISEIQNSSRALDMLETMQKIFPDQDYPCFYKGMILNNLGNSQKAAQEFEQALARNTHADTLPDICSHGAVCLKDMEKLIPAIDLCKKGLETDPRRPDLLNTMGACYFLSKEYENAMGCFEKAINIDPSIAINYANMGSCCRELGRKQAAVTYYETALSIDPSIEFARENIRKLQ